MSASAPPPAADRPDPGSPVGAAAPQRRRQAAVAGHRGDAEPARRLLVDPDPAVRATALRALQRCGDLADDEVRRALQDQAPGVRRAATELAATHPGVSLLAVLGDRDPFVAEMAAWAAGERRADPESAEVVARLVALAGGHREPLVREAAVAALGALEAPEGRAAVLAALHDKPHIRRRAVLALAAYEGDDIDAALHRAASDRDWQVRDAAAELLRITDG
jgi:HEAT repeat protein